MAQEYDSCCSLSLISTVLPDKSVRDTNAGFSPYGRNYEVAGEGSDRHHWLWLELKLWIEDTGRSLNIWENQNNSRICCGLMTQGDL